MDANEIKALVEKQHAFFNTGATLAPSYRINALKRLRAALDEMEPEINAAIKLDLGKSAFESYMCETGMTRAEVSWMIKHTRALSRERHVATPIAQLASRSFRKPSPMGVVLIMSPWNYPLMLALEPLTDAIAAGNTVILKPSAYSPNVSAVLEKLIKKVFSEEYVAIVTGGRAENQALLDERFDKIFFTGSQAVGKEVMAKASRYLTPVVLELGGKSPCIIDETANIKLSARRIVFGKFLNCGQTCVAPDYFLVDSKIHDKLVEELKKEIVRQFGASPLDNENYGKIINQKHFDRVCGLMQSGTIVHGGKTDATSLRIEPTILDNVSWKDPVMQEEIFGPLLPIITFNSLGEVIDNINSHAKPLALYIFSSSKANQRRILSSCAFGGGCINDTIIHLATSNMPFGGVGESGMGGYHGKVGFETFSHLKSIVDKKTWMDLPMRYQPYRNIMEKMIRLFLR